MAQQVVNVGTAPNSGNGDPIRVAFQKTNANTTELYSFAPGITGPTYFGTDSGVVNAYVFTHSGTVPATLAAGTRISLIVNTTNTSSATLNADSTGAVAVIRANGSALTGGELSSLGPVVLQSTGTQWQIVSTAGAQPGYERTAAELAASVTATNYSYPERDPFRYGATGLGVADDATAFQTANNVAAQYVKSTGTYTYGTPHVSVRSGYNYLISSFTVSSGVGLVCDGIAYLTAKNSTGVMIDTPVISSGTIPIFNVMVKGLYLFGAGSTGTLVGLRINNCQNPKVEQCRFSNFAAQGLLMQSKFDGSGFTGTATSQGCIFDDVRCFNCALAANTIGARTGQFQIMGTDHEFIQCEAVSALSVTLTGASKFRVSWNIVGVTGSRWVLCKGSVADQGWYIDSNSFDNFFSQHRADANWAEGMIIDGTNNWFEEVEFSSNGQNTNNTYDHLVMTVNSSRNFIGSGVFNGIISGSIFNRYCITDNGTSTVQPNRIGLMVFLRDSATGGINNVGGTISVSLPDGAPQSFSANVATPSIINGNQPIKDWATANSGATTITNFTGGFTGMVLRLHIGDVNTTIQNGANIHTISGANIVTPAVGTIFNFYLTSAGVWQQM